MNESFFQNIPLLIILIFTLIPLITGSFASKNSISTVNDFFVCGRSMGTAVSFFTVYSTWWSSFAFLGSISYFYSIGSVYWTGIAWNVLFGLIYMLFGLKLSAHGKLRNYITPIDFFSDIYSSRVFNLLAAVIMIIFAVAYIQLQLYGGAIIIEIATKGLIPWQLCALIFYVIMVIYLWAGGLRAVAWADIFYGILIFLGMIAAGIVAMKYAGGVEHVFGTLSRSRPELLLLSRDSQTAGIPRWLSMFILLPLGELMSPPMWSRIYATKERKTFYIMPFLLTLATIAYLGSVMAGSAAAVLKPTISRGSDSILPMILVEFAPGWIMAMILCCGAAACLSTANSNIHSISAILTLNIYKKYVRPAAAEKHVVFIARIIIILFSAFTYLILIFYNSPSSIVNWGFLALSVLAQLVIPAFGALIWKKSNKTGAIWGVIAGEIFTLTFSALPVSLLPLSRGVLALALNLAVFILCGLFLPLNQETAQKITFLKEKTIAEPSGSARKKIARKKRASGKNLTTKRTNEKKMKLLWGFIILGFCAIEFPGIYFINRIEPFVGGFPFIYGFPLIVWVAFCILTIVGFRLKWGRQNK